MDLSNGIIGLTKLIGFGVGSNSSFGSKKYIPGFDFQAGQSIVSSLVIGDSTIVQHANSISNNISVYASGDIFTTGSYINASDRRIKYDIESYSLKALEQINALRITTYKKIDDIHDRPQIGFIAQEVNEVIPESITKLTMYIPNIFQWIDCEYKDNQIIIENKFNLRFRDKIQLVDECQQKFTSIVIDIENNKAVFELDNTNIKPNITSKVLVYGKKIEDFHTVDKDMIFAVAVASIQELSKTVTKLQEEINELKVVKVEPKVVEPKVKEKVKEKVVKVKEPKVKVVKEKVVKVKA